ncbi:MAG: SemiSWEET family transporter [Nitrososphaeraceae archaeon]
MEDYGKFILPAIGFIATGFAVSSTVPQISKALRTKKSDDISLRFIVVLIIGLSFWVIYGIGKRDVVLIIGNSIAVILNTILLILKIKYSRDPLIGE